MQATLFLSNFRKKDCWSRLDGKRYRSSPCREWFHAVSLDAEAEGHISVLVPYLRAVRRTSSRHHIVAEHTSS